MRTPRLGHPAVATVLASAVAIAAAGMPLATRAQEEPSVRLPTVETRDAERELATSDGPRTGPSVFDGAAAVEAALAQVARFVTPDWDITELAGALEPEPRAAYEFVRDHIGFDPYTGILRGAHGTLVARSGNAWDRALLLKQLLEAQGHPARLVRADLDAATAADLLSRAMAGPAKPLTDPDPAELLGLDLDGLITRARRDHALLADALGAEFATLGAESTAQHQAAVSQHVWVQAQADDGSWLDLDPTLATMAPGDVLGDGATTLDQPPPDLRHALEIRVIAETLAEGLLSEQVVLDERLDAAESAGGEAWLTFHPDVTGVGGAVVEVAGEATWMPVLSVGPDTRPGMSFAAGGGGEAADFFFGGGSPELTALRIELVSVAPGREPLAGERILLDRVSPADRVSGAVLPELLAPLPPPGEVLPGLAGIHQVLVSNGASDLRTHAVRSAVGLDWAAQLQQDPALADEYGLHDVLFPLATANQSLVMTSERSLTDGIGVSGKARAFVGRPRGYLVSLMPEDSVPDGTAIVTDLTVDDVDVLVADGAADSTAAHVRLWHGALQTALETELALMRSRAVSPDSATLASASLAMDGVPRLVRPDEVGSVDAGAGALRRALGAGELALVLDDPTGSFWAVDPGSGRTRSVSEPGVRMSFIGGGNYTNSSFGGERLVVGPNSANDWGTIKDGKFTSAKRQPPSRCSGGTEYVIILGCVSLPASMTVGMAKGVVVTAIVSWATALIRTAFALSE